MKRSIIFATLLGSALLLGACGDKEKKDEPAVETETEETANNLEEQGAVDKSDTAKSDDELKEELGKEEGVSSVSIIVTEDAGGFVLVDFTVTEDMKEDQAQKLADQFADKIKEKYSEYKIDVQARKNGETFAQKTID
ncbi:hypothetical protein AB1K83_08330 [Sporosarcina sp. 179-K 3D1 HS]|uniref:hypothetical protein n=1 Tax=Sporosarcina sp. 179-K 3D1 HS TaxID=3232169 RepID=UPI0039A06E7D